MATMATMATPKTKVVKKSSTESVRWLTPPTPPSCEIFLRVLTEGWPWWPWWPSMIGHESRRPAAKPRLGGGASRASARSRRAQRAQRALPEAGSVPYAAAHSSASSIAPPAPGTERNVSGGRCGTVPGGCAGQSHVVGALRQRRATAAQAARVPGAATPPMAQ